MRVHNPIVGMPQGTLGEHHGERRQDLRRGLGASRGLQDQSAHPRPSKNVIAPRMAHALIPRHGEVVAPGKIEDPRSQLGRQLARAVARTGIDDDGLIHQVRRRFQASRQLFLLVPMRRLQEKYDRELTQARQGPF